MQEKPCTSSCKCLQIPLSSDECPQGAEHCVECRKFQDGDFCVDHCPSGVKEDHQTVWKYSNATGHCLPCNTNCTLSWVGNTHADMCCTHTKWEWLRTQHVSFQLHCEGWERLSRGHQDRVSYHLSPAWAGLRLCWTLFSLSRLGTTIAAAVGGVVLFFILLGLLLFYLRRQKKLKRKETMRRILQEHEVGCRPSWSPKLRPG